MDLDEARRRTEKLMAEHGLHGWRFDFDRAVRRAGNCDCGKRRITLSRSITELNEWPGKVEDTVLHEIAHALSPRGSGHGRVWKAMALKVGATPTRCFDDAMATIPGKWQATCKCEGKIAHRQQRPRPGREYWCTKCKADVHYERV